MQEDCITVPSFVPNEYHSIFASGLVYVKRIICDLDIFYRSVFLASYGVDIGGGDGEHSVGTLKMHFVARVGKLEVERLGRLRVVHILQSEVEDIGHSLELVELGDGYVVEESF